MPKTAYSWELVTCHACNGSGETRTFLDCPECGGQGEYHAHILVEID